jgi:hypothetical protein
VVHLGELPPGGQKLLARPVVARADLILGQANRGVLDAVEVDIAASAASASAVSMPGCLAMSAGGGPFQNFTRFRRISRSSSLNIR